MTYSPPTPPRWDWTAPADVASGPAPADPPVPAPARTPATDAPPWRTRRERLALAVLLGGTAVLYLWGLGASGYANDFYAAAVQAGTRSWKAFFFGSIDSSSFITVDKPPASLWPMELSGRIFGFSSWSMLVPQALMGVASVALLYGAVRRWFGGAAGLLAGALLALTPVAVLMFRFNNPDASMTLLVVVAAYCVTRALDRASTRWLLLAGTTMGFAFLAKGLQPFTVLPALAVAYLVAAPASLRRRLVQLLAAGAAVVAGAGWWVLAVDLIPASARPYIGGSGDNSALGLAFGYNGLSRITGSDGAMGGGFSGATGVGRLFNSLNGGQIAWLLPTALIALVALLVISGPTPRTDRTRAAALLWGGWLVVTGAVLSFAGGIIHTYYGVELAPAIAALVAVGAVTLWRRRAALPARIALAAGVLVTAWWSMTLLHRSSGWYPWIATLVVVAGIIGATALLVPPQARTGALRRLAVVGVLAGTVAIAAGPAAYAVQTAATPHTGSTPSAGPAVTGGAGGFGGGRPGGVPGGGTAPARMRGALPGGAPGSSATGPARGGSPDGAGASTSALAALLRSAGTTWAAATIGDQSAASLELASGGSAVMAIGGWSGSDATPSLAEFERLVAAGKIHYYVAGSGGRRGGPGGDSGTGSAITSWVEQHFSSTTVGGTTVYDLTKATSS